MSKNDVGSAKWISNQIRKNSTKTKIRWYCGLCQVACKDENGYKCHLEHEGHIHRQMAMEDSLRSFKLTKVDREFRKKFLDYITQKHFGKTVLAHEIYRDIYPIDRGHNIMKSTCWGTLGVFIAQLKKEGRIEAQKGLKGWQIRVSSTDFQDEEIIEVDEKIGTEKKRKEDNSDECILMLSLKRAKTDEIKSHTESSERTDSSKVQFSMPVVGVKKAAVNLAAAFGDSEESDPD
jgi:DNA/RNA-binding protein KIN17